MATWRDVARIVGELALTSEPSPHDWRVGKKLLAWERPLRPSDREALAHSGVEPPEGDILAVRVSDEGVKYALIADEPTIYFTTPHFDGYPAVLIRLAEIGVPGLEELITEAWLTQAPRKLVEEFLADSL
ncbi:MmcQ/YjbR family DNA-binding protein [Mycobacterium sp.]|uniref:MmcQ/YjbR family DNA-binding protein n=1 Tax=Mycobacterium sp. TaxID=1785 RepID=UPI0025F147FD|nr:MmcQ/YjbR family DNA-binding protein [Mycobacterium sp.]MBW0011743.1 MmcQ/YjbR family DNA-binding protein [Mycobacterium sp.]